MNYYLKDARNVMRCGDVQLMEHVYDVFSAGRFETSHIYATM